MTYDRLAFVPRFALLPLLAVAVAGCTASTTPDEGPFTKERPAALMGRSDMGTDICDLEGWYGDGICDEFCLEPDQDCVDCLAVPTCEVGETAYRDVADCPADASCREVTVCGTTIWCSDAATCAGYPSCGPDETERARWQDCAADASCREVELCGATIWCESHPEPMCAGDNPQGCLEDADCDPGSACDLSMGAPSGCYCDPENGSWACTPDLSAGTCVRACIGDNPQGCFSNDECDAGETCDLSMGAPSGCVCEPGTGTWACTPDLSAGVCVAG